MPHAPKPMPSYVPDSLQQLQRVQNNLARIVYDVRYGERHSADLIRELHWLSVSNRVNFKLAVLCYRAYKLGQPSYLRCLIEPYVPARQLRSLDCDLLT